MIIAIHLRSEISRIKEKDRHHLVLQFCELDGKRFKKMRSLIRFLHLDELPTIALGEMGFLRGEIDKKRKYRPIRTLGNVWYTITFDNGNVFADHKRIPDSNGGSVYFVAPYHSWEWGLNEHTKGLVCGFLPKGTNFHAVSDAEVWKVQEYLNNRLRKDLDY